MGMILMILGVILAIVGGIGILIVAFRESVGWGIGCLILPIVSLVFVVMHWEETKKPFLLNLAGTILAVVGGVMSGPSH
jgi:hypothetical protein